jgi:nucleotide-binding universal stress UspA family protein
MLHQLAARLGSAAVVVGSTHRGHIGRVVAGDIAAALLHGLSCPVAVAPRGYTEPRDGFRRLGVGFVDDAAGRQGLAAACALARRTGGSVRSITVLDPTPWAPAMVTPGWEVPRSVESEREASAQTMAAAAQRSIPPGVIGTAEVMHGEPAKVLAEVSSELDLLVCGSRGYGPARAVLLGGVGRKLAHTAHSPLLVIPREPIPGTDAAWDVEPTIAAVVT